MTKNCAQCGNEFNALGMVKTCSPDCRAIYKTEYWRLYHLVRRHTDPAHRRMKNQSAIKNRKKRMATDPAYRAKVKARNRVEALARHNERKHDPEYRAKNAAKARRERRTQAAAETAVQLLAVQTEMEKARE